MLEPASRDARILNRYTEKTMQTYNIYSFRFDPREIKGTCHYKFISCGSRGMLLSSKVKSDVNCRKCLVLMK